MKGEEFPELGSDFVVDTETTGLYWWRDKVFSFGVCTLDGKVSRYYDLRRTPKAIQYLKAQVKKAKRIIAHNVKFDTHMLREAGVPIDPDKLHCTQTRAALCNEHELAYTLDNLARVYLKRRKVKVDVDKDKLIQLPFEQAEEYCLEDIALCRDLFNLQEKEIENQDLFEVLALERRLLPHLLQQERDGIRIDVDAAERSIVDFDKRITVMQRQLDKAAGFAVNPNPSGSIHQLFAPKQGKDGIWRAKDGTPLTTTPAGKPSLGAEALKEMKDPSAMLVLKLRKMIKARDTFLKGHVLGHLNPKNNRVHPHINQTKGDEGYGTGTGRLSYNDPALQQIPNRDKEMAAMVRPVFLPDEGQQWCYGDLEQHEFRIFAHYTKAPKIIDMYRENPDADFHQLVTDLTGIPRNAPPNGGAYAKQLNLGIVFSMGAGKLAAKMGLPYTEELVKLGKRERIIFKAGEETMEVLAKYHAAIPGVKEMINKAASIARERGYVRSYMGRHLRFPDPDFAYKAAGLIYQATAADLNKNNIINICNLLQDTKSRFMLNIHDEYSVSIDPSELHLAREMRRVVESGADLRVPIRIDFSVGKTWWDATRADSIT